MKNLARMLCGLFGLALAFVAGYAVRPYGPSIPEVLHRVGVPTPVWASHPPGPRQDPARALDPRKALELLGLYTSEINTRIEALSAKRKEKQTAIQIMKNQGEEPDSKVLRRLAEERAAATEQIANLEAMRQDALDVEARLQRFIDAEADVEGGFVQDQASLVDARSVLTRLESLGGWRR